MDAVALLHLARAILKQRSIPFSSPLPLTVANCSSRATTWYRISSTSTTWFRLSSSATTCHRVSTPVTNQHRLSSCSTPRHHLPSSLPLATCYLWIFLSIPAGVCRQLSRGIRHEYSFRALNRRDRDGLTFNTLAEESGICSSSFDDVEFRGTDVSVDANASALVPPSGEQEGKKNAKFVENMPKKEGLSPNYLTMSDKELFSKCRMDTYRASGPGGQHRNKTESAVRLTHIPTGLVSQACDDRSQHVNRALALTRLRQIIALEVRSPVELECYKPPPELVRILPSGIGGKRGNSAKIGPNHPDFVLGVKPLVDLLWAVGGSVSDAGTLLGLSTGAMSKLITSNNLLWQGSQ